MTMEEAKFKIVEMYFKNTEYYGQDFEALIEGIYDDFEQQLAEYKKRIEELEAPKSCETCKWYGEKYCKNENSIAFNGDNAVYEDDCCKDYEPKDK